MKYAFMSFSCPELSLTGALALAGQLGYDGFEPRLCAHHAHGIEWSTPRETLNELRKIAQDSAGVELCCLATSCTLADGQLSTIDDAKRAVDLADYFGAPRIRVFGGALPDGISREEAIDNASGALITLSDFSKNDVITCLETHDDWCDPRDVISVMTRVNRPNIGVNWDIMHPALTAKVSIADAFTTLKPYIRHVHAHDGSRKTGLTFMPIGQGEVDHLTAIRLLKNNDYSGYISGEWINWDRPNYLETEIRTLREYENS